MSSRSRTVSADVTPTGSHAGGGTVEGAGAGGQADGPDVVGEGDSGAELHERDVVVEERVVVVGVRGDPRHGHARLVGVAARLHLTAQVDRPAAQLTTDGEGETEVTAHPIETPDQRQLDRIFRT